MTTTNTSPKMVFFLTLMILSTLVAGQLWAFSPAQLDQYRQKVLRECNYARTAPQDYARVRLLESAQKGQDNGAYQDLMSRLPVGSLSLESRLIGAAQYFSEYMAQNNVIDHYADGKSPMQRISAQRYRYRAAGENLAAGNMTAQDISINPDAAAIMFVLQLIIDDGVEGVGHRLNIMSPDYTELGVGYASNPDSDYGNYTVQDFATPR